MSATGKCAACELIAAGAIGWFHAGGRSDSVTVEQSTAMDSRIEVGSLPDDAWTRTDGQWLIHCTRRRDGPWPGETERQYRDSILLGEESSAGREPLDALLRIVRAGRMVAGATATTKRYPVVCFSALSLQELLQRRCFRPQLGRWDYEPYGIAIRLSTAKQIGIQAVIYGDPRERSLLSREDQYRFHPLGKTYDWREEREWRSSKSVDLAELDPSDIRVFAEDSHEARRRLQDCRWPVTFVTTLRGTKP